MKTRTIVAALVATLILASAASAHTLHVQKAKYWTWEVSVALADEMNYSYGWDMAPYRSTSCYRTSRHRIVCDGNIAGTAYLDDGSTGYADCYFPVAVKFANR